ncbi:MAG TPA: hypothetical protein VF175_03415 [Lacipirellula sp.]
MKTLFSAIFMTTTVVGLMPGAAIADDGDAARRYRRWHREQFEAQREWAERQEELAEERREWEEERRERLREWQEEQKEAAERYRERQREMREDEQEWRREHGRHYSYRPMYPPRVRIYRGPEYIDGPYYEQPAYGGGYYYAPGRSYAHDHAQYAPRHYYEYHDHDDYNPRGAAIGSRIGARIGAAIAGGEGAAIGGRLGAEIGGEID